MATRAGQHRHHMAGQHQHHMAGQHWHLILALCLILLPLKLEAIRIAAAQGSESAVLGSGFWSVNGTDFIDSNNNTVYFSGVTWAGFETPDAVVHGLWMRTLASHLDQMHSLGFNMIRLPFAGETLREGQKPTVDIYGVNPDLKDLTSLEIMDKVIEGCTQRGIKVILDYHRIRLTVSNEKGMWFDEDYGENVWINNWAMLARRYKGNPTVIGADLFNEVHPGPDYPKGAPFWALPFKNSNEKYNFRSATWRVMKAIRTVEPNWIMFFEGMGHGYWWGGDVAALLKAPITKPKSKIAFSCHEYGPRVYMQKWFLSSAFPRNMEPIYRSKWGLAVEQGFGPVWVGEFGSFYPPATDVNSTIERTAFESLIDYMHKVNVSWTIAFWNPNSKDTGGILNDDWQTVNEEKLKVLEPIMHFNFTL